MNVLKTNRIIIRDEGWGDSLTNNILSVLTSSINLFEKNIKTENYNQKMVFVQNTSYHCPKIDYPVIYKGTSENLIYINVKNKLWSNYAYQFAHEYCHHLIESNFINSFDQFGWFEESICELASIHSIKTMAKVWKYDPPYSNWHGYSSSLEDYAEEILNRESNKIEIPLSKWIETNIYDLSKNRYQREKNCIIAKNIFDLFQDNPTLWNTIPLIGKINTTAEMDFKQFIYLWEKQISETDKQIWIELKYRLIE